MKYKMLLVNDINSILTVITKQEALCYFFTMYVIAVSQFLRSKYALNFIFKVIDINMLAQFQFSISSRGVWFWVFFLLKTCIHINYYIRMIVKRFCVGHNILNLSVILDIKHLFRIIFRYFILTPKAIAFIVSLI